MSNPNPKTDHLPKYQSKWKHTPTKLIRVPEIYAEVVLKYARELDSGEIKPSKRIELLSDENIIAVYAPYDRSGEFQETAKQIEGYQFEYDDKSWRWSIDCIVEVVEAFPDYWQDPNIPEAIALVQRKKKEAARIAEAERIAEEKSKIAKAELIALEIVQLIEKAQVDEPLPCGWSLFDHQKEAVKWLLTHIRDSVYQGGILADHMGLGKSLSALVAAKAMRSFYDCPIFIVCPASLKDNWLREAGRAEVAIEVFSWAKVPKPLDTTKYLLIADEAHYMQNIRSQRTKKLLELAKHENCLATWLLSLAGETPVVIKQDCNKQPCIKVMTMEEAVNFMGLIGEGTKIFEGKEKQFSVRTFNQTKQCMEWATIYGIQAHYSPEALITIKAQAKISIRVTKGHSLYVFRDGKIIQPKAQNIVPGDYLIKDANISIKHEITEIDLVQRISSYPENIIKNYVIYGDFEKEIVRMKENNEISYDTAYNWINNGKHGIYMTYEKWIQSSKSIKYHWICGHKASKGRGAKTIIPVCALAWLVGYTIGDGWVTENRLELALANSDLETVIAKLHQDLDPYFNWSYGIRQYKGCVNLRINCKPLVDLFLYWFSEQKAFSKRIPSECLNWNFEARKKIIEGLIDSDGHSKTVKSLRDFNLETTTIYYTSVSKMLLEDIKVLLLTLGIESAIHRRKMKDDLRTEFKNSRQSYTLIFCISRIEPSYLERQTRTLNFNIQDAQLVKVLSVTSEPASKELVYDFAVENTENFVGAGVVCHNTGTPIKNGRPINLYPLLYAVNHPLAPDEKGWDFQTHYCNAHHEYFGDKRVWDNSGAAHLDELSQKTEDVILRRTKDQCLDLPPKIRTLKAADMTGSNSHFGKSRNISSLVQSEN